MMRKTGLRFLLAGLFLLPPLAAAIGQWTKPLAR
jgi:hypothetical protein